MAPCSMKGHIGQPELDDITMGITGKTVLSKDTAYGYKPAAAPPFLQECGGLFNQGRKGLSVKSSFYFQPAACFENADQTGSGHRLRHQEMKFSGGGDSLSPQGIEVFTEAVVVIFSAPEKPLVPESVGPVKTVIVFDGCPFNPGTGLLFHGVTGRYSVRAME